MFVLFVVILGGSIYRSYVDARESALQTAAAAAQVASINARWITELSRQALARIDEALGQNIDGAGSDTIVRIAEAISLLPGNVKSYVVAADGRILFSTDANVRPVDIRDREYFRAVAQGELFHVSPILISRLDQGTQIFVFARRIARNGRFVAAAMISFDVVLLSEMWQSLGMDETSSVSFIRDDGQLVARFPLAPAPLDLSADPLFSEHLPQAPEGTYTTNSPADGSARIVGYRRVPGTDLVALAAIGEAGAMAPFWRNTIVVLLLAVPTAIALAFAVVAIFKLLRRDERQRLQLSEALDLNRMLVRDTHHRVKNNLQAIMSLVRLHRLPGDMKQALQHRISAMTAVHEHLYRLDQFTEVNAATLIPAIVDPLVQTFGAAVEVSYEIEAPVLDRDHATPLALVVNEAVTNALKYAFEDGRGGHLDISLRRRDDELTELTISDDGLGFDRERAGSGLGSRLIAAMLLQLGGATPTYEKRSGGGTLFKATLDLRPDQTSSSAFGMARTST